MRLSQIINAAQLDNKKIILIVLGIALIFYLDYNFVIKKQYDNIKTLQPRITKLLGDIDGLKRDLSEIETVKSNPDKFYALNKQVISETQLHQLILSDLGDIAVNNNVKIIQTVRFNEEKKADAKTKTAKTTQAAPQVLPFAPLFIDLDVICGYHDLGLFINDLENANKYISVQSIEIFRDGSKYLKRRLEKKDIDADKKARELAKKILPDAENYIRETYEMKDVRNYLETLQKDINSVIVNLQLKTYVKK